HVYAYAANNPTTWTDPSGQLAGGVFAPAVAPLVMETGYGPLLLSPARLVVLVLFAEAAVTSLTALMVLEHLGLVAACAQVPSCAAKLAEAAGLFSLLTVLPEEQPLWGIVIAVFPEVTFAIAFAGATEAVLAIKVCVESGECKEKKEKKEKTCI